VKATRMPIDSNFCLPLFPRSGHPDPSGRLLVG
jgi:hypothetical protein